MKLTFTSTITSWAVSEAAEANEPIRDGDKEAATSKMSVVGSVLVSR